MPEWIIKYFGGGLLVLLGYIAISNTLWLLFGSKLLQSLPGVNIKGIGGTLKIATLLLMTIIGFLVWLVKWPIAMLGLINKQSMQETISFFIQYASKLLSNRL